MRSRFQLHAMCEKCGFSGKVNRNNWNKAVIYNPDTTKLTPLYNEYTLLCPECRTFLRLIAESA